MPKITQPTIREHRASVRAALIEAAGAIVTESGVAAVLPGSVTERAGVARSTFYKYFAVRDDVLAALAIQAMEEWDAEIAMIVAAAEPGRPRLRALVDATMAMTGDGKHDLAAALRDEPLSPTHREDLMALHDALFRPVVDVLGELGVDEPRRTSYLVQGVLGAGVELVMRGVDPTVAADDVHRLIAHGILD